MRNIVETLLDRAEWGLERVRWLAAEAGLAKHLPRWTEAAIRVCLATGAGGGGRVTESLERAAERLERALGEESWDALQAVTEERDALEFERDCALERVEVLEARLQTDRASLEAEVQVLREERDGALADNAELFDAVCRALGWSDEIARDDLMERLRLREVAAMGATEIEPWQAWGEGRGLQPGEAVLPRSHPGARRVGVRRTSDGGVAVRTVDDDGVTPIGPSVYFREAALRTFLDALADRFSRDQP